MTTPEGNYIDYRVNMETHIDDSCIETAIHGGVKFILRGDTETAREMIGTGRVLFAQLQRIMGEDEEIGTKHLDLQDQSSGQIKANIIAKIINDQRTVEIYVPFDEEHEEVIEDVIVIRPEMPVACITAYDAVDGDPIGHLLYPAGIDQPPFFYEPYFPITEQDEPVLHPFEGSMLGNGTPRGNGEIELWMPSEYSDLIDGVIAQRFSEVKTVREFLTWYDTYWWDNPQNDEWYENNADIDFFPTGMWTSESPISGHGRQQWRRKFSFDYNTDAPIEYAAVVPPYFANHRGELDGTQIGPFRSNWHRITHDTGIKRAWYAHSEDAATQEATPYGDPDVTGEFGGDSETALRVASELGIVPMCDEQHYQDVQESASGVWTGFCTEYYGAENFHIYDPQDVYMALTKCKDWTFYGAEDWIAHENTPEPWVDPACHGDEIDLGETCTSTMTYYVDLCGELYPLFEYHYSNDSTN